MADGRVDWGPWPCASQHREPSCFHPAISASARKRVQERTIEFEELQPVDASESTSFASSASEGLRSGDHFFGFGVTGRPAALMCFRISCGVRQ
jgi:hypothetical protein